MKRSRINKLINDISIVIFIRGIKNLLNRSFTMLVTF